MRGILITLLITDKDMDLKCFPLGVDWGSFCVSYDCWLYLALSPKYHCRPALRQVKTCQISPHEGILGRSDRQRDATIRIISPASRSILESFCMDVCSAVFCCISLCFLLSFCALYSVALCFLSPPLANARRALMLRFLPVSDYTKSHQTFYFYFYRILCLEPFDLEVKGHIGQGQIGSPIQRQVGSRQRQVASLLCLHVETA